MSATLAGGKRNGQPHSMHGRWRRALCACSAPGWLGFGLFDDLPQPMFALHRQVPQFVLEDAWHRCKPNRLPLMYHALPNVLQVPQFILEDAWYRCKGCRVVCTQPRRISAVSGGWGLGWGWWVG